MVQISEHWRNLHIFSLGNTISSLIAVARGHAVTPVTMIVKRCSIYNSFWHKKLHRIVVSAQTVLSVTSILQDNHLLSGATSQEEVFHWIYLSLLNAQLCIATHSHMLPWKFTILQTFHVSSYILVLFLHFDCLLSYNTSLNQLLLSHASIDLL